MANYDEALKTILVHEGGAEFTDDPADPGGATKYGISLRFLKEHGIDLDHDGDIDADDVKGLSVEDSARLYKQYFWNLVHGDDFASQAMATKLFDMAVNMGPGRAIHIAQESAGIAADGIFGPQTFRTLNVEDPKPLLTSICSSQAGFYRGIVVARPASQKFLAGWLVRSNCTRYNLCKTCLWKGLKPL
jgi:lysozyme family protein